MSPMVVVVCVLAVGGATGGLASLVARRSGDAAAASAQPPLAGAMAAHLVLGLAAAACVPLFLNLLKSDLIAHTLQAVSAAAAPDDFLVLFGISIIAGYTSRAFLDAVSDKLWRQQIEHRVQENSTGLKVTNKTVAAIDEIVGDKLETPPGVQATARVRAGAGVVGPLDTPGGAPVVEQKVLDALRQRAMRTTSGIAEDVGLSRDQVSEILDGLAASGIVEKTTSENTGGVRWAIPRG